MRLAIVLIGVVAWGQSQSGASSYRWRSAPGGETVETRNVTYQHTGVHKLVLRQTVDVKEPIEEVGLTGSVVVEAWKEPGSFTGKPAWVVKSEGVGAEMVDHALLVVARGMEDVAWWSVYALGSGKKLFDTHVPVVRLEGRVWAGLEVPGDDQKPAAKLVGKVHVVGEDGVVKTVAVIAADAERARLLRSYFDVRRVLALVGSRLVVNWKEHGVGGDGVTMRVPVGERGPEWEKAELDGGLRLER